MKSKSSKPNLTTNGFYLFLSGVFIEKKDVTDRYKFFNRQVWMATYERHPDQKGIPLKPMPKEAWEYYYKVSGKPVKQRKLPKQKKND